MELVVSGCYGMVTTTGEDTEGVIAGWNKGYDGRVRGYGGIHDGVLPLGTRDLIDGSESQ